MKSSGASFIYKVESECVGVLSHVVQTSLHGLQFPWFSKNQLNLKEMHNESYLFMLLFPDIWAAGSFTISERDVEQRSKKLRLQEYSLPHQKKHTTKRN